MSTVRFFDHRTVEYLLSCLDKKLWNHSTILIVLSHVNNLVPNLDEHDPFIYTVRRLHSIASQRKVVNFDIYRRNKFEAQKLDGIEAYLKQEVERIFIRSFVSDLRRFFKVPNLMQLSEKDKCLRRNEILAGFLAFVLQVLDSDTAFRSNHSKQKYAILQKNLTFILTILGDSPFWCSGIKDVNSLLAECESVVNKSGYFVYSRVFENEDRAGIEVLLEKIYTFLNENLKNYSFRLSNIPKIEDVRSCSRLLNHTITEDFISVINGQFGVDRYQINNSLIRTRLKYFQMQLFTHSTTELEKPNIQTKEVMYEAAYLINTLVMGNIPSWYLNFRLNDLVMKFELSRTEAMKSPKVEVEVEVEVVIGFEYKINNILDDLTRGSKELRMISIYGMSGIGKTTIARKVYNNRNVYDYFDLRAWCVVSQTYDRKKVLTAILASFVNNSGKDRILRLEEESLGSDLHRSLVGRRYLIILDDVWYTKMWNDMSKFFPDNRNGSRILLTSRTKDTAPADSIFHALSLLSESQCFDLLMKKIFINKSCPPKLFGIAKGIATKCCGLPLAVMVVAGIMVNLEHEESKWKNVEANLESYLYDDQSMRILELSYEHLPDHLKPCFLYLGRFREDEEVLMRKVIKLWIAEGFVHGKEENNLEQVAEGYFLELLNRSLLMIAKRRSDGGIKACGIHDLVREMCLRKAEEQKFLKHIHEYNRPSIYEQYSHLVVHTSERETFAALHCRSLTGYLSSSLYQVTQMPLLRVIDEFQVDSSSSLSEIERIYRLVHLNYLSFYVHEFPVELCKLVNLVYLYLDAGCQVSVPSSILKMVNLRHVQITTEAVFERSRDSSILTNKLNSLSYVLVRNEEESEILKCSPHLRKLKSVVDRSFFPDLRNLNELQSLTMKFTRPPMGKLTNLYFPLTIKKLSLYRTGLHLEVMARVGGLPNLCVLKLLCCAFVGEEWTTIEREFPTLRYLKLSDVSLKQWITRSSHFPQLEYLMLELVVDLVEIPYEVAKIPCLQTIEVRHCGYGIERSAVQIEKSRKELGNDTLMVIITSDVKGSKDELERHVEQEKADEEELHASETGLEPRDIELVMTQTWVSRARAVKALKDAQGNLVHAIMKLA